MGAVSFMILQAEAVVQGQLRVEGRPSQSCSSTTTTSRGKNSRPRRSCCCGSSCTPLTTSTTTTTDGLQRFLLLVWLHFLSQIRPTKNNLKKAPRILRAIIQFSVKNKAQFQNDFFFVHKMIFSSSGARQNRANCTQSSWYCGLCTHRML